MYGCLRRFRGCAVFFSSKTNVLVSSLTHGCMGYAQPGGHFAMQFQHGSAPVGAALQLLISSTEPTVERQRANEAFNSFLTMLCFPNDVLNALFTCTKCELTLPDGSKLTERIVMEDTAAGILGELSRFERTKRLFQPCQA